MRDIVIVGVGGHGREMLQLIADVNARSAQWNVLGFVDDASGIDTQVHGYPVLGSCNWLHGRDCHVVVAIGAPAARRRVVRALEVAGVTRFATLVHPSAQLGQYVQLGEGCMVCAAAVMTTDVSAGSHVIVNTAAVVSHDCQLADFATVAPRACLCGGVRLGEGADVGAGSTLIPRVSVADWTSVGAGAVVTRNVETNATVVGVPARSIAVKRVGWQDV